jgi:hypothetical protein
MRISQPDRARRWPGGEAGWQMTGCTIDLRPGDMMLMAWLAPGGGRVHILTRFIEVNPKRRTLHVEQMVMPDPTTENRIEPLFAPMARAARFRRCTCRCRTQPRGRRCWKRA